MKLENSFENSNFGVKPVFKYSNEEKHLVKKV